MSGGSDRVRIAFLGCGSMANAVHYPSLASFADVEVVAACDLDTARLEATADRWSIAGRYTDYRQMIEETSADAVYAIGQPHQLYDAWMWILSRGLPLCVEKPLGLTLHQARSLVHVAEQHHCITQVSLQRRAVPLLHRLRNACLSRGAIRHAVCEFYKCQPEPFLGPRDHMMDDGVHAIDTLRWLCGGNVHRVQSVSRRIGTPDINFISALLEFESGATGVMVLSWTSGRRVFRVQMHGPGICADADPESMGVLFADGDTVGERVPSHVAAGGDELYIYGGFQAKNRQFIDAVKGRRQPESSFADALCTMEIAERILAQALD